MKNLMSLALSCVLLVISSLAVASDDPARAYLVDGVNETRSGPIRESKESEILRKISNS